VPINQAVDGRGYKACRTTMPLGAQYLVANVACRRRVPIGQYRHSVRAV